MDGGQGGAKERGKGEDVGKCRVGWGAEDGTGGDRDRNGDGNGDGEDNVNVNVNVNHNNNSNINPNMNMNMNINKDIHNNNSQSTNKPPTPPIHFQSSILRPSQQKFILISGSSNLNNLSRKYQYQIENNFIQKYQKYQKYQKNEKNEKQFTTEMIENNKNIIKNSLKNNKMSHNNNNRIEQQKNKLNKISQNLNKIKERVRYKSKDKMNDKMSDKEENKKTVKTDEFKILKQQQILNTQQYIPNNTPHTISNSIPPQPPTPHPQPFPSTIPLTNSINIQTNQQKPYKNDIIKQRYTQSMGSKKFDQIIGKCKLNTERFIQEDGMVGKLKKQQKNQIYQRHSQQININKQDININIPKQHRFPLIHPNFSTNLSNPHNLIYSQQQLPSFSSNYNYHNFTNLNPSLYVYNNKMIQSQTNISGITKSKTIQLQSIIIKNKLKLNQKVKEALEKTKNAINVLKKVKSQQFSNSVLNGYGWEKDM